MQLKYIPTSYLEELENFVLIRALKFIDTWIYLENHRDLNVVDWQR